MRYGIYTRMHSLGYEGYNKRNKDMQVMSTAYYNQLRNEEKSKYGLGDMK